MNFEDYESYLRLLLKIYPDVHCSHFFTIVEEIILT